MCMADVSCYAIKPDSDDADRSCCEDYSTFWILCQHLSAIHMVAMYRKHFYAIISHPTKTLESGVFVPLILMRKQEIRKVKRLIQGYRASKWKS